MFWKFAPPAIRSCSLLTLVILPNNDIGTITCCQTFVRFLFNPTFIKLTIAPCCVVLINKVACNERVVGITALNLTLNVIRVKELKLMFANLVNLNPVLWSLLELMQ